MLSPLPSLSLMVSWPKSSVAFAFVIHSAEEDVARQPRHRRADAVAREYVLLRAAVAFHEAITAALVLDSQPELRREVVQLLLGEVKPAHLRSRFPGSGVGSRHGTRSSSRAHICATISA